MSAKIMRTSNQLTDDEMKKTAFPNIMDEAEIEVVLHEMGSQEVKFDTLGAPSDSLILTKRDEYVIDGSHILSTKIDALSVDHDYYLLNIFNDGVSYVTSGNASTDMGTEQVSFVDLITYENWSKK